MKFQENRVMRIINSNFINIYYINSILLISVQEENHV